MLYRATAPNYAAAVMMVRTIVDLSHGIDAATPVYPGDPQPSTSPAATIDGEGFNVLHVRMGSQTGTHVDAPYHFVADGARVDELDLAVFLAPAVFVDVRDRPPRTRLTWEDFAPHAPLYSSARMVVVHTGWSRHWGTPVYFDHPFVEADAAARLMSAGVRTIALDTLNLDETDPPGRQPSFAAHHEVLGRGGVIAENLTNLEAVDWPDPLISLLPLRLTGADGAPIRAVAFDVEVST